MIRPNTRTLALSSFLVCSLTGAIACGGDGGGAGPRPPIEAPYPELQLAPATYADCDALNADMRALLEQRRIEERRYRDWQRARYAGMAGMAGKAVSADSASPEAAADTSSQETFTNVQEQGVDEADIFKVGGRHLYAVLENRVEVIDRASLAALGTLDTAGLTNVVLYAEADRLVLIGERIDLGDGDQRDEWGQRPSPGPSTSEVRVYGAASAGMPALAATKSYAGVVRDSRSVNGHLILVFSDYLRLDDPGFLAADAGWSRTSGWQPPWNYYAGDLDAPGAAYPLRLDAAGTVAGTPCHAIMRQSVPDYDLRLTRVVSLNTAAPDAPEHQAAVLGGGDQIYMSPQGLYLTKTDTAWFYWWDPLVEGGGERTSRERVIITRLLFNATSGEITPAAVGAVAGRIKDQWSFKEYPEQDVLAVTTSTGILWDHGADIAQNHLWILKPNPATRLLDVAAAIRDFGTGEDIRAVRYVGSMAYVVTFKKTDPLFAFDLANPLAPQLLGALKVPGFSVYMHPVADDLMVGVGFDAADQGDFALYQGVQVSLFDVADPMALSRVDNHVLGTRGSSSEVTSDHHAFFYDAASRLMAVPVVELRDADPGSDDPWGGATELAFSGAVVYDVGRQLTERARISHADLMPATCKQHLEQVRWWQDAAASLDVNRVFKVDGQLLSLSRFGLRAHPLANPGTVTKTVAFAGGEALCPDWQAQPSVWIGD